MNRKNTIQVDTATQGNSFLVQEAKYYFGKLCKRQHDYQGSGQSLRYKRDRCCIECYKILKDCFRENHRVERNKTSRAWRQRIISQEKETPLYKKCSRCNVLKQAEAFYLEKYSLTGLRNNCKQCDSEKQKARLMKAKKPARHLPLEVQTQRRLDAKRRYKRTPKGKAAKARYAHKRRALLMSGVHAPYTQAELHERFALFGDACAYCGSAKNLTLDHVVPLTKNGTDGMTNIVPACLSCNSGKSNKDASEWYQAQLFYSNYRWQLILTVTG